MSYPTWPAETRVSPTTTTRLCHWNELKVRQREGDHSETHFTKSHKLVCVLPVCLGLLYAYTSVKSVAEFNAKDSQEKNSQARPRSYMHAHTHSCTCLSTCVHTRSYQATDHLHNLSPDLIHLPTNYLCFHVSMSLAQEWHEDKMRTFIGRCPLDRKLWD